MPIDTLIAISSGTPARRAVDRHRPVAHRRAEPFGDDRPAVRVGLRQQHHELLPALPERHVHLAQPDPDPPGELAQHRVPRRVPVRVVDLLEVVEVEHQDGQHPAEPAGPLHLPAQRLPQVTVVPQAGQRVGERKPLRLLVDPYVVHRDPGLPGEGPQGVQVGVVEGVAADPVVEGQHAQRGRTAAGSPGSSGSPTAAGAQIGTAT